MTLLFTEGFDMYSAVADMAARGWGGTANSGLTLSTGRFGGAGVGLNSSNVSLAFYINQSIPAETTVVIGTAFRLNQTPGTSPSTPIILFTQAGAYQVGVWLDGTGHLHVVRGNNTAVLASYATALNTNTWYYIEFQVTIGSTTGAFDLHLGGVSILSGTSVNTQATATANVDGVYLASAPGSGTAASVFDDIYLLNSAGAVNNTFLGERRVQTIRPSADSAVHWTPTPAGSNFSTVNEAALSATNYVTAATAPLTDTYAFSDLPSTPDAISGVTFIYNASKSDTGAVAMSGQIISGATTANGASQALSTSNAYYSDIYELDPNGSAAWTGAAVNALTGGVTRTA